MVVCNCFFIIFVLLNPKDKMKKEFVPYEQSLALKELGFDEPCLTYYFSDGAFNDAAEEDDTLYPGDPRFYSDTNSSLAECRENELKYKAISAPTFSQSFRFFREKYGLRNSITDFIDDETGIEWDYEIAIIGTDLDEKGNYEPLVDYSVDDETRKFKTYEEAELGCLIKLIEIVKNK